VLFNILPVRSIHLYIFKVPEYHERPNACSDEQYAQESSKPEDVARCRDFGGFKAVQTHVDHSDAFAIVTTAGCPLGQIWRIVGLGWRSLYNRRWRVRRPR